MTNLEMRMLRIRRIEEEIARRYPEQEMRCPVHLSIGQEAPAVALCSALLPTDLMVSTHRGHAHYLAKGGDLKALISELYGKATGCSKGQGGSMHLVDWACGFAGSTSIVGGTIPIGVGLSFAHKLRGENHITAVCIGDAAVEEGVFHEAANFASLHQLRVLFFCENNLYSCYTHISQRQRNRRITDLAAGHGIMSRGYHENKKVWELAYAVKNTVDEMRIKAHPRFMEVKTFRLVEHCGPNNDDHLGYRDPKDIEIAKQLDVLRGQHHPEIEKCIKDEIDWAFDFAKKAPYPDVSELGKYVYANS